MAIATSVLEARSPDALYSLSVAGALNVALTMDQVVPRNIILTGALTGSITITFPVASGDAGASWVIHNNTSGAYSITVQAASGGGSVVCAQGKRTPLFWDGANMKVPASDAAAMGLAASGANADITSMTAITGGVTGSGAINFDKIQGNAALGLATASLAFGRLVKAYPSDANYTASAAEAACPWIEISAGTVTAGRNFVLPLNAGSIFHVYNVSGQTITFIGTSGTGVAVATGKRAICGCDGTNFVRFSADV